MEKFSNNPNNSYNQPKENTKELQIDEINQAETVGEEQLQQSEVEQTVEKKKSGKKIIAVGAVALVAAIGIGVAKMNSDKDTPDAPGTTVTENEPGTSDQETDNGLEPGDTYTIEGNMSPFEKYLSEDSLSTEEICEEVDEKNMANAINMKTGNVEEFLKDWFIRNGYNLVTSNSGINEDGIVGVSVAGSFDNKEHLGVVIYQNNPEEFNMTFSESIIGGKYKTIVLSQIPTPEQADQIFSAIYGE